MLDLLFHILDVVSVVTILIQILWWREHLQLYRYRQKNLEIFRTKSYAKKRAHRFDELNNTLFKRLAVTFVCGAYLGIRVAQNIL